MLYKVPPLGKEPPRSAKISPVAKHLVVFRSDTTGISKSVSLYNNMPLNREGFLNAKPLVKKEIGSKKDSF